MTHKVIQSDQPLRREDYPADAIFFFDFDGVVITQCEEKVFRLPETPTERRRLEELAPFAGIDHRLYLDTAYLRHLLLQAFMCYDSSPHLPVLAFMRNLGISNDPYFIVTARSGLYAVKRLNGFLRYHDLCPQEVFCLGRSSKADLLAKLRTDWPDRPFVYFEDTMRHIEACKALDDPLLEIIEVEWPTCTELAEKLRREVLGVC